MKHLGLAIKFVVVGFFALLVLLVFSLSGKIGVPKKANADSLDAYPSVCLGGWQNPGNASGPPDVSPGSDSFTGNNSAVLNQAQAQIFCGSFQASDESQTPTAVTLHFSWNVIFANQASNATSSDADSAGWSSVLDATSTATSTTPAMGDGSDASSTAVPTTPSTTSTSTPPIPTPPLPPAPVTPPASDPSNADASSTSFLQTIFSDPLGLLIEKSFADSTGNDSTTVDTSTADNSSTTTMIDASTTADSSVGTANDFVDVSYSLDGTTWIDLGPVSESDWQNYSVTIPVNSWSDINNLQIQLSPLITPDAPTIYLDGMWLEVDYNNSILSDIAKAISDILPTDTLSTSTTPTPPATPQDATTQTPAPLPPPPPPIPQHQYLFTLQGPQSISVKGGKLDWYQDNNGSSSAVAAPTAAPTVSLPATNTIEVSGSCSAAYYTILIFPDAGDYESNPSLALYNNANKCVNGSFTQTITDLDLPSQLASGTYYLVVANQGAKGPWIPYPETYPIQLSDSSNGTSSSQ